MKHDRGKLCGEFFDCHHYIVKADQFADYRAATLSTAITTAEARHGVVYDATGKILWPVQVAPPDKPLPTLASTNAMRSTYGPSTD